MSTEPTTELIEGQMSAPPVVASAPAAPVVEKIPDSLLEICRDDMADAQTKMDLANKFSAEAEGIAGRVQRRISAKMNLLPVDTFNLETGIVTRGGAEAKP